MKWQIWTATKTRVHVIVAKRYETGLPPLLLPLRLSFYLVFSVTNKWGTADR